MHMGSTLLNHIASCQLCRERIKLRIGGFTAAQAVSRANKMFKTEEERRKKRHAQLIAEKVIAAIDASFEANAPALKALSKNTTQEEKKEGSI